MDKSRWLFAIGVEISLVKIGGLYMVLCDLSRLCEKRRISLYLLFEYDLKYTLCILKHLHHSCVLSDQSLLIPKNHKVRTKDHINLTYTPLNQLRKKFVINVLLP